MDTSKNIYLIDKEKLGEESYFRKHFNRFNYIVIEMKEGKVDY